MRQLNRLNPRNTIENKVDISQLKEFAYQNIPSDWPLRDILLAQNDEVDVTTFLACLPIYLQLSRSGRMTK
jgi:hypothetical protein